MKKIGLISAMIEESSSIQDWLNVPNNHYNLGEFKINEYIKGNVQIYHITSGVGEILGALATQILILNFGCELIINFGLCGSLKSKKISDMVVVRGVVHYDFDTTALDGGSVGKYSRFRSAVIETDIGALDFFKDEISNLDKVICASADKFVADENMKKWLYESFNADICEMESAGILIACKMFSIPNLFIKVVSDAGDNQLEFNKFLQECDFKFASILEKIIDKLN